MAQNNYNGGGQKFYFNIIEGELRRKAKQDDNELYVRRRTNKSQQEVEEFAVGSLSGIIEQVFVETKEFGGKKMSSLIIQLSDVGEVYVIQIPVESKYFGSAVEKLPNIDYTQYVTLSVYDWTPPGESKRKAGVTFKQAGNKVASAYSKENPLPGVSEFPKDGDDDEKKLWGIQRTKALKKVVENEGLRLNHTKHSETVSNVAPPVEHQEQDDLPF